MGGTKGYAKGYGESCYGSAGRSLFVSSSFTVSSAWYQIRCGTATLRPLEIRISTSDALTLPSMCTHFLCVSIIVGFDNTLCQHAQVKEAWAL